MSPMSFSISTTGEMKYALSTSVSSNEDSAKNAPMLLAISVREPQPCRCCAKNVENSSAASQGVRAR